MFERNATTQKPPLLHRNDPGGRLPSIAWLIMVVLLLVGISAPAGAQCGADPGDDDFATATDLGSACATHSAAIDCSGDLDYYTFTAPESAPFTFSVASGNPSTPVRITLYNTAGTPVGTSETAVSYTLNSGDLVWVKAESVLIGATPTYDLQVSGCTGGICGADPGNDDVANATWFPGCAGYAAAIDCIGDLDFYEWSAPSSGSYTFQTTGGTDTFLELFDGGGGLILSDDDSGAGTNARIVYTVVGAQTYYVRVSEYNNDATGAYELDISGCSGGCGADPGDDTGATPTFLNAGCATISGYGIDCPGDIDFYSWTATDPGTYTFAVSPTSTMRLTLFTSTGSLIQEGPSVTYTMTAAETVHIRIMAQSSSDTPTYTLSISGCSTGGCGSDPGNDYLGSATPLPGCGPTSAAIDCTGDLDYYWLTAPNSGSFTFETTGSTDTELRLYDANGDAIASDDDSGSGSNAKIVYTLTGGQKYSVAVNEYNNDATGAYELDISGCSTGGCGSDPGNEDTAHATDLGTSCGTTPAAIDCTGDTDFYAFTAIRNGVFTFAVSSTDTMRLTLFTAVGNLIGETTSTYNYTLSAGEKVYVRILPQDGTVTQSYDLIISGCNPSCGDDPGNDYLGSATPLSGCGSTSAAIDCIGDLDYYWLTAPSSGSFTFETTGSTDTELRLYDANGDAIASDDDSGSGTNAQIVSTLVAGQKYSVAVNEHNNDATGDYALVISGCSAGSCGNDPGNDDLASATAIPGCSPPVHAAIDCVGDLDFYSFVAPNSGDYIFQTTTSDNTDTQLVLYDSGGGIMAADDNSGNGNNALIQHALTGGQTYKIQVNESGNDGTGNYSLFIDGCSSACGNDPGNDAFDLATSLGSACGNTPAAIDCDNDSDYYAFTAAADTTYTFTVDSAGGIRFELFDSSQQLEGSGTTSFDLPMTPGEPVWIAVYRDSGVVPISYTLTISGCSAGGCGNDPGDDDIAHAIDLGSSCTTRAAAIDCASDVDVYRFTVPSDGVYTYSAIGSHDTYVYLKDSNGNTIHQTGNSIVQNETAGTLRYFQVAPITTNDAPFDYTLSIAGCATGGCGNDPGNDDRDHATNIGTGVGTWPAAIDCPGDTDVYTFTAPQTANYTIMTTGSTDTWIEIADSAVIATDDNSGQATNASLTADLSAGTRYFVTVKEASGTGTGNYELAIAGSQSGTVHTYIVPATAKITGLSGTDWRSDLSIVNTKWSATLVTIEAWMRDQANPSPAAVTRVISGGGAFNKTDLLASLFGFGSGSSAALRITSENELVVSTRTYNLTANGTYGQYIPGRDLAASFQVGETAYLQGFREDAQARSNLGLVNLADVTNNITVTFFGADGSQLGSPRTYAVPAHGFIQRTRVLREVSSNPVELAWARLTAADGPFVGYLSLIDAASGDPTFRPTMAASTESSELILPGIAKVHGASSTNWVSDMVLLNTTSGARQVSVELWVRDDANASPQTRTVNLAARECQRLEDVLPGLFGMSKGAAAFRITAGPGVIVDARTFNQVSSGSYGQYVPSMYRIQGILSTQPGLFPMVTQNTGYRTNLGLVNGDTGAVEVTITLLDESGTAVSAPITVQLADRAVTQIDRIVNRFTTDPFSGGYLKLGIPSSYANHPVHAFVTVVDQKTGDPVYLTPAATQP